MWNILINVLFLLEIHRAQLLAILATIKDAAICKRLPKLKYKQELFDFMILNESFLCTCSYLRLVVKLFKFKYVFKDPTTEATSNVFKK